MYLAQNSNVGTDATLIVPARPARRHLSLRDASGNVRIGNSDLSGTGGFPIGNGLDISSPACEAAVYGIVASGSETVNVLEFVTD